MLNIISKSPAPENSGDITSQQNTPVSANQVSEKGELPKRLAVYIPENLDLNLLLEANSPNFKGFHKDKFLYILHLITDIPAKNKDVDYDYVPLYSKLLRRKIGDTYNKHFKYLVENGILVEDKQYIVGKKSKGYKFSNQYSTKVKVAFITKYTLIKNILKFSNLEQQNDECLIIEEELNSLNYLYKWYNEKLTIDYKSALNLLGVMYEKDKKNFSITDPIGRFNRRFIPIDRFHRGQFSPSIDATAGRLHSALTQIKSEFRQFIEYDGKPLVSIDIKNSQPYLSCIFLNEEKFHENNILSIIKRYNNKFQTSTNLSNVFLYYVSKNGREGKQKNDVTKYIEAVSSGMFYEEFGRVLKNEGIIKDDITPLRKQAKKITFSTFFSPNHHSSFNDAITIFKRAFPEVFKIFSKIKSGSKNHPALACVLQNFEAKLILHTICKVISEKIPDAPLFTLHDSIITTEEYQDKIKKIMYCMLKSAIGISPSLSVEKWETRAA